MHSQLPLPDVDTESEAGAPHLVKILAGRVFDPYTLELLENRVITVDPRSGLIVDVQPFSDEDPLVLQSKGSPSANVVDLRGKPVVLPGFVDVHVHRTFTVVLFSECST